MLEWLFGGTAARRPECGRSAATSRLALEALEDRTLPATSFIQTNLVSDVPGLAQFTDPNLHNAWGVAVNPTGDFWVANAGTGTVTLYNGDVNGSAISRDGAVISTPIDPFNTQVLPSGIVLNTTRDFVVTDPGFSGAAPYIVAGLDGTLTAIAPTFTGTTYTTAANYQSQLVASTPNAVYTGLTIGSNTAGNFIYVANPAQGRIDVFNSTFQLVTPAGSFTDPSLPTGYTPFNIANINGTLYVTYKSTATPTVGGVVDKFDTNGNFLGRFAAGGTLNAPWAVVQAPTGFGSYAGDLLVGNFGDGHINVFDPSSGAYLGQLTGSSGQPIAIPDLWQLIPGNGKSAGNTSTLYFSAGINGEQDGLFGSLQAPVTAAAQPNPAFVNQVYLNLLGRPADAAGLAYWSNQLNNGVARTQVVNAIENSSEFRSIEINSIYERFLNRSADGNGLSFWEEQLNLGVSLEQVEAGIVGSQEFFVNQGGGTVSGFLTAAYQDVLGRAPDATGTTDFTTALQNGASRTQVAAVLFASEEFKVNLLQGFYQTYLHRPADASGLSYWVNQMGRGVRDQDVIAAILSSNEFLTDLGIQAATTTTTTPQTQTPSQTVASGGSAGGGFFY